MKRRKKGERRTVSHVEVDRQTSYPIFFEITFRVPILHTRESKNDEEGKLSVRLTLKFRYSKTRLSNVTNAILTFNHYICSFYKLCFVSNLLGKGLLNEKQSICHTYVISFISHLYNQKSCTSFNNLYKSDLNYCAPVTDCYIAL